MRFSARWLVVWGMMIGLAGCRSVGPIGGGPEGERIEVCEFPDGSAVAASSNHDGPPLVESNHHPRSLRRALVDSIEGVEEIYEMRAEGADSAELQRAYAEILRQYDERLESDGAAEEGEDSKGSPALVDDTNGRGSLTELHANVARREADAGIETLAEHHAVIASAHTKLAEMYRDESDRMREEDRRSGCLRERLRVGAERLVGTPSGRAESTVILGSIRDRHVAGGRRAAWLREQMVEALRELGFEVRSFDPESAAGVDGIVRGSIESVSDSMLEVTWRLERDRGSPRSVVTPIPRAIAPYLPASSRLPEVTRGDDAVDVRIDAHPDGSLCGGEESELWVRVEQRLHVRIVQLAANGGSRVMDPPDSSRSPLEPGRFHSFGSFEAVGGPEGAVERFVVIAAETEEGLGWFAEIDGACRLPPVLAANLHVGRSIPLAARDHLTAASYRIVDNDRCSGTSPGEQSPRSPNLERCWSG